MVEGREIQRSLDGVTPHTCDEPMKHAASTSDRLVDRSVKTQQCIA